MTAMNFRDLIDEARNWDRALGERPRTIQWVAKQCGISTPHVYNLINGTKVPNEWTIERIAHGLGYDIETVREAIHASRTT